MAVDRETLSAGAEEAKRLAEEAAMEGFVELAREYRRLATRLHERAWPLRLVHG